MSLAVQKIVTNKVLYYEPGPIRYFPLATHKTACCQGTFRTVVSLSELYKTCLERALLLTFGASGREPLMFTSLVQRRWPFRYAVAMRYGTGRWQATISSRANLLG